MSDVSVRDAARRFAASGTVDDEVCLLRERVRTGRLAVERVRVCAYLGHEAARRTVGHPAPPEVVWSELARDAAARTWKYHLRGVRKRELVGALLAAVDVAHVLAEQARPWAGPPDTPVDEARRTLRAWLAEPDEVGLRVLEERAGLVSPWSSSPIHDHLRRSLSRRAVYWALGAAVGAPRRSSAAAVVCLTAASQLADSWPHVACTFTRTLTRALLA